jgi:hypothetical protein
VQVRFVDGQAMATGYFHDQLGPATGLQKGDVVLQAGGVKVGRYGEGPHACRPTQSGLKLRHARPQSPFWKLLPNNIGYLSLGTVKQAHLPLAMAQLQDTKGLVIDIRNYPAEFAVFSLTKYLLATPVPFVKFSQPQPAYPGVFLNTPTLSVQGTKKRLTQAKS